MLEVSGVVAVSKSSPYVAVVVSIPLVTFQPESM